MSAVGRAAKERQEEENKNLTETTRKSLETKRSVALRHFLVVLQMATKNFGISNFRDLVVSILAKKYGDIVYNRKTSIGREGAISVAIDSISVVSDVDIDASHPKGTELSDIVKLNTRSHYLFIKSGYKETNDLYTDKDKFMSEYTKEDLTLLFNRHGLIFHFDNTMALKGAQNLAITIYFENGKILSTTQAINFD